MATIEIKLAERMIKLNRKKLQTLIEEHPDYQFRFFIYGTDGVLLDAETNKEITAEEMFDLSRNFQIKDFVVSDKLKVVEVDVVLFPR